MQAAFYERTGAAAEVLQLGELPDPQPGPGELRVRLRWSGVNPSDVKTRAGLRSKQLAFPRIVPHSDGMGVVDTVGEGVAATRIGQRVWIWNGAWGRANGTSAQFIVLPARQAVPLPAGTPDEAAACFGIPALTALHAVLMAGGVAGQSVLVAGGAGAVGHYAVQFAKLLGARQVIATVSSEDKARIVREAGADLAIDYRRENLAERVREATGGRGLDRVIEVDIAANRLLDIELLRKGGDLVVYGSGQGEFALPFFPLILKNLNLRFFMVYHLADEDRARAEAVLADLLGRGVLRHQIAQRLPLAQIVQAHELVESGRAVGNVVIELP
ncbi:MAG: NADPH:quinone reductase [Piscinibacter sp.]